MIRKPDTCRHCPLYGDGVGFVPDEIIADSRVMVVLQNPGEVEEREGRPTLGRSGSLLCNTFLPAAGLRRGDNVSIGNVLRCRWKHTNDLPPPDVYNAALAHCQRHYAPRYDQFDLVVTAGEPAFSFFCPELTFRDWVNHYVPRTPPLLVVLHPSAVVRDFRQTIPTTATFKKIPSILEGTYPKSVPGYRMGYNFTGPTCRDIVKFASLDTEYHEDGLVYLIGIAYFDTNGEVVDGESVGICREFNPQSLVEVVKRYPVVTWNAVADTVAIEKTFGIRLTDHTVIHDAMQLHALWQSELRHDLESVEPMFSPYLKMKHLAGEDIRLYNWGDVLTTGHAYTALMQYMTRDPQTLQVYSTQNRPLIEVRHEAKIHGLRVNGQFLSRIAKELKEKSEWATAVGVSYTGLRINLGSEKQVIAALEMEGVIKPGRLRSLDDDTVAKLRQKFIDVDTDAEAKDFTIEDATHNIEKGGHPLLEARALYQKSETLLTHFIKPLTKNRTLDSLEPHDFVERVYPDQHTHTQASGRWSVQNPPLATLPPRLREMILPDPGYALVKYDADQQELRITAALANDEPTLAAFERGDDIHTLNTCDIFNLPYPPNTQNPHTSEESREWRETVGWEGKDDKRRVFAKRFVYRLLYLGNPKYASDIPGAKTLGLDSKRLVECSETYLSKHPALKKWWRQVAEQIRRTRQTRSLCGRRRFLNGEMTAKTGIPKPIREGTNHIIQSSGVDWNNLLILTIWREWRRTRGIRIIWGYGAHDSHVWLVPQDSVDEFVEWVTDFCKKPMQLGPVQVTIPISVSGVVYG